MMILFIAKLFKQKNKTIEFSKSSNLIDEFIRINGSIHEIVAKINAYGLGYKIEQYKLFNSFIILNAIEVSQIFGEKQLLELSKLCNMNKESIKDEIARNLMHLIK